MKAILVKMQCVTNLHVGNGDVNYNIIDNEVERDPITGNPTINSSGVKGALRQYFTQNGSSNVDKWFGDEKEKTEGQLKILAADLMAMPMRASRGPKAYYLVSPKSSVERYAQLGYISRLRLMLEEEGLAAPAVPTDLAIVPHAPSLLMWQGSTGTVVIQGHVPDVVTPALHLYAAILGGSQSVGVLNAIAPFEATYVLRLRLTRSEEFEPTKTTTPRCPVPGLGSCRMKNLFDAI